MLNLIAVAVGGGCGAVARYIVSVWAADRFGAVFPYGTLLVNVVGCFVIGAFMVMATERVIVTPYWRLLVAVGFLGGLTTFSSFGYETFKLLEEARLALAAGNIFMNMGAALFATWLGMSLARLL